ncbi:hypothetical protein EHS39_03930 [Ensifer sp. MPMI2T]|nr:hypothetical protein EHS39_03930 [Ensifer sp. MPMI2T]
MTDLWPWLSLAGLGAFHGVNPAMGWLFAVALGLHRQSSRIVWLSLLPIAAGHAAAIAVVLTVFVAFGTVVDLRSLKLFAAALILGLAGYYAFYGHRHRVRVGMRTGMAGLAVWSFLMATGHGAGLMLMPAVLGLCLADQSATIPLDSSLPISLAAVALHTGATLVVTAAFAFVIIEWVGLAVLRSAWINFDLIWTLALVVTGVVLVVA